MTSLIEELKQNNLQTVYDTDKFAFKKGNDIVTVPWPFVTEVTISSKISYYGFFGLLNLLKITQKIPLGIPIVETNIVIKFTWPSGETNIYTDKLSTIYGKWYGDSNSGPGYGFLKMAVQQSPKTAISKDAAAYIQYKTTPTIEAQRKKATLIELFFIGIIGFFITLACLK